MLTQKETLMIRAGEAWYQPGNRKSLAISTKEKRSWSQEEANLNETAFFQSVSSK